MRRSNCAGALQYVPELTWILFLRILDEREQHEAEAADAVGAEFAPSLEPPYRWRDWAAPDAPKRRELESGALSAFINFVNSDLIPHLKALKDRPNATPRQRKDSKIELRTLPYEVGSPARTTVERLAELTFTIDELGPTGQPPITAVTDKLNRAFSVEAVTKRFYQEIANWYFWAREHVVFPIPPGEKNPEAYISRSLIRLITRLIFCWFVKQMGLIPGELFDPRTLANLLKNGANLQSSNQTIFYKAILQNLFFATLNQEIGKRQFRKRNKDPRGRDPHRGITNLYRYEDLFTDPEGFLRLVERIPFLNGGLFECLDQVYRAGENRPDVRIDGFSDHPKNPLSLPDYLFFGDECTVDLSAAYGKPRYSRATVRGLIHIFNRYNFTVTESTPLDQEVALDPEMAGKIFENLLASYNPETATTARKATGSYYTPREIVDYMVDEALIAYLKTKMDVSHPSDANESRIRHIVAYNDEPHQFSPDEVETLITAIDDLKALDPACGSGAFPMGLLHKLVHILRKLDPRNEQWKQRQIARVREAMHAAAKIEDATIRERTLKDLEHQIESIEDAFARGELDYGRKLYLIENCIYGVDIQPIAVQIAKMRFFISLTVDQRIDPSAPNLGIRPLPNLETKFVAANTLIGIERPAQAVLRNPQIDAKEAELQQVRERHFTARTAATKARLRELDANIRAEISELLSTDGFPRETTDKLANWNPYDHNASADFFDPEWMFGIRDGFDIVIGNPPWGQKAVEFSDREKDYFREHYRTARGILDIFRLFCECSLRLTRPSGAWTMILPDIILLKNYEETRRMLLSETAIEAIVHTGMAFEAAQIDSVVIVARKTPQAQTTNHKIKAIHEFRGDPEQKPDLILPQALFWKLEGLKFNIHLSPEKIGLLDKLRRYPKLCDFFEGHEGIHSGNIRDKLFLDSPRGKSCRKLIFGRDEIGRFRVSWGGKWVNYNSAVIDREAGEYANLGHVRYFESPKVFVRRTGDFVMAALDRSGLFASNNLFIVLQKAAGCELSLEALTGILNSRLITWFFRAIQPRVGKLFAELKINQLHLFPLPPTSHHQVATQTIVPLVDKILAAKRADPAADTSALEREIDQRVYRLYGLTPDEIKIVEEGAK
jgi:type I restriction-modification system DNA methylase subunit